MSIVEHRVDLFLFFVRIEQRRQAKFETGEERVDVTQRATTQRLR